MPKEPVILDEAAEEARSAFRWYQDRSKKAAARFQQELDRAVEKICDSPNLWPPYMLNTHFYRLRRFPYLIVYRETTSAIEIIAVAHAHRREGYWKSRLR
jgi:plasmid stabilization system protein ParE